MERDCAGFHAAFGSRHRYHKTLCHKVLQNCIKPKPSVSVEVESEIDYNRGLAEHLRLGSFEPGPLTWVI